MSVAVVTGSSGLVGSECVRYFSAKGMEVVGIDNDMRRYFFGEEASTDWMRKRLLEEVSSYTHFDIDIRQQEEVFRLFKRFGQNIELVIHAAAQPSHDWAAREPLVDFSVNATGTLVLLEATRSYAANAAFIYMSTNKVYGDRPNELPLVESSTRWSPAPASGYEKGIGEDMPIDRSLHSLFGASKAAADLLVQEYGRYFGMKTACFRGGCLTGPNHSGAQLHGFLAYLVKCCMTNQPYTVFGYKGKQVRDNIHSADLVLAFDEFFAAPRRGEVYNMGGGVASNCSMLEAIQICEEVVGQPIQWQYTDANRVGDHIWYISNLTRFRTHYPKWQMRYGVRQIMQEIFESNRERWQYSDTRRTVAQTITIVPTSTAIEAGA
jgi:CDP-paratose 2-epimerase